jgi:hypothetical protein
MLDSAAMERTLLASEAPSQMLRDIVIAHARAHGFTA